VRINKLLQRFDITLIGTHGIYDDELYFSGAAMPDNDSLQSNPYCVQHMNQRAIADCGARAD
jgi:hypothetical protein